MKGSRPLAAGPPGARRYAPALIFDHSALCTRFPTHKYPLNLFEPIPVALGDGACRLQRAGFG
jgi:hypothetical protein